MTSKTETLKRKNEIEDTTIKAPVWPYSKIWDPEGVANDFPVAIDAKSYLNGINNTIKLQKVKDACERHLARKDLKIVVEFQSNSNYNPFSSTINSTSTFPNPRQSTKQKSRESKEEHLRFASQSVGQPPERGANGTVGGWVPTYSANGTGGGWLDLGLLSPLRFSIVYHRAATLNKDSCTHLAEIAIASKVAVELAGA
nr:hypothetical protein Iba_chr02bCG13430 [Ipomoea batatas]